MALGNIFGEPLMRNMRRQMNSIQNCPFIFHLNSGTHYVEKMLPCHSFRPWLWLKFVLSNFLKTLTLVVIPRKHQLNCNARISVLQEPAGRQGWCVPIKQRRDNGGLAARCAQLYTCACMYVYGHTSSLKSVWTSWSFCFVCSCRCVFSPDRISAWIQKSNLSAKWFVKSVTFSPGSNCLLVSLSCGDRCMEAREGGRVDGGSLWPAWEMYCQDWKGSFKMHILY